MLRPAAVLGAVLTAVLLAIAGSANAADPPMRIVSTAPSITEMLYALGLGERVVGVTDFCHYPPEVIDKPKIGSYINPNFEVILAMQPDLVIVLKEHIRLGERLRAFELPVLELRHNTLAGIEESLLALGRESGVPEATAETVGAMRRGLDRVRSRAAKLPRRKVVFFVGRTPGTLRDLVAVGARSFLNELITIAGGDNIFGDAANFYPRISREELLARAPEVIVDMGDMGVTIGVTEDQKHSIVRLWESTMPGLPAVREARVYAVAEDHFMVPGPRVVPAAEALFAMIHPEAGP